MSMDIRANKGDKVVYTNEPPTTEQALRANLHLKKGETYTVERTSIYNWNTDVYLQEVPNVSFKSVMFDDVEQTLEEQVNECKEQTEDVALIAVHDGRILLKVDVQGFVTIGETVVGHEPGLPRLIELWKEQAKKVFSDSEFNPGEAFECKNLTQSMWFNQHVEGNGDFIHYVGLSSENRHVVQDEGGSFFEYEEIRNVKKPGRLYPLFSLLRDRGAILTDGELEEVIQTVHEIESKDENN